VAPQPQVFTNAAKATALANAQAALPGAWYLVANWDGLGAGQSASTGSGGTYAAAGACPGERWQLGGGVGRIELILLSSGSWQALLFPGN
jgi:hypothetical protein